MSNTDSTTKSPILEVFLSTNTGPRSTIFVLNKSYGFQGALGRYQCQHSRTARSATPPAGPLPSNLSRLPFLLSAQPPPVPIHNALTTLISYLSAYRSVRCISALACPLRARQHSSSRERHTFLGRCPCATGDVGWKVACDEEEGDKEGSLRGSELALLPLLDEENVDWALLATHSNPPAASLRELMCVSTPIPFRNSFKQGGRRKDTVKHGHRHLPMQLKVRLSCELRSN